MKACIPAAKLVSYQRKVGRITRLSFFLFHPSTRHKYIILVVWTGVYREVVDSFYIGGGHKIEQPKKGVASADTSRRKPWVAPLKFHGWLWVPLRRQGAAACKVRDLKPLLQANWGPEQLLWWQSNIPTGQTYSEQPHTKYSRYQAAAPSRLDEGSSCSEERDGPPIYRGGVARQLLWYRGLLFSYNI